jgi:oxygen-independent coproporphyrinogen-3 oxidase
VFGLRRIGGVSRRQFRVRTSLNATTWSPCPLRKFIDLGMLVDDGEQIRITREGLFVSDAMWPEML